MTLKEYVASIKNKRITVIGIGVSNLPLIRLLAEEGCCITACDKRTREVLNCAEELEKKGVKLHLGENYLDGIEADILFRTPGIRPDLPQIRKAVENGAELSSEMELFFEVCPCRIIAVTGSDGKTTTTTLISELLKAAGKTVHVGGNIGKPLLCDADNMASEDFAVVELSSFQLMTMHGRAPEVAVITNVAPNHLDIHKSMEEYTEAKKNICRRQTAGMVTVLNMDNDISQSFQKDSGGEKRFFSMKQTLENGVFCVEDHLVNSINGRNSELLHVDEIRIPGKHNVENYMAAFCAVRDWVSPSVLRQVAMAFAGVEHRIEFVRELNGVRFYNDSIASSPSRTRAGLNSFREKVILIAGGKDKGVPFDELGGDIIAHVKKLVLTGWTVEKIRTAVENRPEYKGQPEIYTIDDFADAVKTAANLAEPGDVVILSPACTSFDKFKNFEERGNVFKALVHSL